MTKKTLLLPIAAFLFLLGAVIGVEGQDTLSAQVLRLLDRANTWSVAQTFSNVVINGTCTGAGCAGSTDTTWTPALTSSGGTLPTFTTAVGHYVRDGHLVHLTAELLNTTGGTAGSGGQQLSIVLPFTTSADQIDVRIQVGTSLNGTTNESIYATIDPNLTTALLWRMAVTGSHPDFVAMTNADFNDANIRHLDLFFVILI